MNFPNSQKHLRTIQDKWFYFIKNAGSLEYVPKKLSKEIEKAYQIANEVNFSEEELELQHRKRDWVYIQKSSIELAPKRGRDEGLQEGIERGLEKGKAEATQQIVLKLSGEEVPLEMIMAVTGLTKVKIERILRKE